MHPDSKIQMLKKDVVIKTFSCLIFVSNSQRSKVLKIMHLSHGLTKTYETIFFRYFWKGICIDTLNFVASCSKCLQTKHHCTPPTPL